jgi:hypothetical protein
MKSILGWTFTRQPL